MDDPRLRNLLEASAKGDAEAFGEFYDATVGRTYAITLRITRSVEDAEEAVCDAYHQVWRQAERFDPARGSLLGWLGSIARSRALDRLRRRDPSALRPVPLEDARLASPLSDDPESLVSAVEEGTALHAALRELSPVQQRLIGLAYFRGLSHAEIADETQLPLGTVKTHIRKALQTLARAMPERGEESR